VKALAGQYVIRADGTLLYQSDPPSAVQTPVVYASSAQPMLGAQTVSQGEHHACAILTDQTVWCWPMDTTANAAGQLGNGTTDASGPTFRASQVLTAPNAPLTKATSLSGVSSRWAGNTCAVTTEGKLYCWGDLSYTAGGGITTSSPYASVITSNGLTAFTSVLQVSVDYADACAVVQGTSSKEVWCWGANNYGQLGTGDTKAHQYPVKVLGIADPSQVVVSNNGYGSFACALDGSKVRCWGSNDTGQLGIGSTVASVPTPTLVTLSDGVTPLSGIVQVEAAAQDNIRSSACALTADHTTLCWGNGFKTYPALYGVGNVVSLGSLVFGGVRFLTSDGVYHVNTSTRAPKCGPI
jgi:alpha-tubulin suppressor-like RCC1 family protein